MPNDEIYIEVGKLTFAFSLLDEALGYAAFTIEKSIKNRPIKDSRIKRDAALGQKLDKLQKILENSPSRGRTAALWARMRSLVESLKLLNSRRNHIVHGGVAILREEPDSPASYEIWHKGKWMDLNPEVVRALTVDCLVAEHECQMLTEEFRRLNQSGRVFETGEQRSESEMGPRSTNDPSS